MTDLLKRIYERAALCRAFEEECFRRIKSKEITIPCYLSTGQEYIPATVSAWLEEHSITDRQVFIQHRGHSTYLCFGGDLDALVLELLGDPRGCADGMGGSASIQSVEANIYGHDGLMGSQGPIAVGACYANRKPTICFAGDAAAEEDYFLAALGWARTHKLPILFIIEDNNLAVLTEKYVRRAWNVAEVARGFGLTAYDTSDDPEEMITLLPPAKRWPVLLNVHTTRLNWHAGAGVDNPNAFDRHKEVSKQFTVEYVEHIYQQNEKIVREAWKKYLMK